MDVGLVILDGWGLADGGTRDAVAAAETPNFDRYRAAGAATTLETHGPRVGLPAGQMGNSEVGHLTIGAGRVVEQASVRITDAIARWRGETRPVAARGVGADRGTATETDATAEPADPPLDRNEAIVSAFDAAADSGGRVHLLGLVSDGGVHAAQAHLHALIDLAARREVEVVTHAITDGRDTPPRSGADHLAALASYAEERGTGHAATVTGRYYAMDRDGNWERTRRAYEAVVDRRADHTAGSAVEAVEASYDRGDTDEFVEPTLIEGGSSLSDGDAVVFANFRADRARQLTRMLADLEPEWPFETEPPDVRLVTMTEYDSTYDLPVAFPPRQPVDTLGEVLSAAGRTQLRVAETEKYAHVTYFLNGGRETPFAGERREIVPSPDVPTYDRQPEMSAPEVTDTAVGVIDREDPDVVVLNYANPDMVGHTGDFDAAVAAVEAVDDQLGRLVPAMVGAGADVLLTADHGNAEEMGTPEAPHTAHTTNPVPFVHLAPEVGEGTGSGRTDDEPDDRQARDGGGLADVAPTVLALAGLDRPDGMTGASLLR
jgi:2,3-bisphosphoglycerate-independent phosphoglycerate mutase